MLGMSEYPDKYFELAIVDPPYGIDMGNYQRTETDKQGKRHKKKDWDSCVPDNKYFNELFRVSKNQIIWGGNYYFDILGNSRGLITWYKKQPVDNYSDCEYAWNSINCPAYVFEYAYYGNIEGGGKAETRIHPTQKPVKLYKWLLDKYAKQGDKILDTHLGSGSSRIACYDYGFDFTGFELDKDYFEAQEKRFKDHISQVNMFKDYGGNI